MALVNSQALQALLAQGWAESAEAVQTGRIANPVLGFERIVAGDELELGRALSFGLLDLLTLPARQQIASTRLEQARLRLASEVVDHITRVRQAWVRAVAAQQMHTEGDLVLFQPFGKGRGGEQGRCRQGDEHSAQHRRHSFVCAGIGIRDKHNQRSWITLTYPCVRLAGAGPPPKPWPPRISIKLVVTKGEQA